jgi:hypothetical protein
MDQELIDVLQQKRQHTQAAAQQPGIDWDERRRTYVAAVEELYNRVQGMLAEPIGQQFIRVERRPKSLTETYIGTYAIDDLLLQIGDEQVRFSPRGRNIAGATGRVDVIGDAGEATLLAQPGARWSFIASRTPVLHAVDFNEAALAKVLRLVMRA